MSDCLSDNAVAAFVSGGLPHEELEAVERHMGGCAACRELVAQVLLATAPVEAASADTPRIGRYRVLREVGAGSMGRVYAAEDPDLGREVAIKVMHPAGRDKSEGLRARLEREARAMARLAHPNVITIYEVAAAGDELFIAMELVKGSTLGRWLRAAPRGWRAVTDVMCAAGRGLAAAHAAGVVHRDFKPDNVLVGDDGRVRVTDFGLARLAAVEAMPAAVEGATVEGATMERPAPVALTATGAIVGTPAYMAPEQLSAGAVDERSDLFSFCVTFWEALHGERPFAGRDLAELRAAVATGAVRPPPEAREVPEPLRGAIRRGLQAATGDRPASMAELLAAIEAAVAIHPAHAPARPGDARMSGEARELTMFVSDLAGFSALAESHTPDQLVKLLEEYYEEMSRIIAAEQGTVDKYLGDGILAFWGPEPHAEVEDAVCACTAALRCQARVRQLAARGAPLSVRIGIATGPVLVGRTGSPERTSYTVMLAANLIARRLERHNKQYGTALLVDETTLARARGAVVARPLDVIAVKERARGLRIYELLALAADRDAEAEALAADATVALDAYLARRFDEAIAAWDRVLERRPGDRAAGMLRARAAVLAAEPPGPDWTGLTVGSEA